MTLHLEQSEGGHLLMRFEWANRMVGKECPPRLFRAIENDTDAVIASLPRVPDKFL